VTTQASGRVPSVVGVARTVLTGDQGPTPVAGHPPVAGVPWFLTIGDSVTFGYTRDPRLAGTNPSWAPRLERLLAAEGRPWRLYDTACSGESTVTYAARCPGRRQVPFLAHESQRSAALSAIAAHRADLRLIVVELGSNDLLHAFSARLDTTVVTLSTNLTGIVDELRAAAPGVPLVLADIYDPFAAGAPQTEQLLSGIDYGLAALASRLGAGFADIHAAINHPADGTPLCNLVDCANLDIHPTPLGQQRLAETVLAALPPASP
jgi:lysophospholipase L1-like esterase